jgi:hypothetical protein
MNELYKSKSVIVPGYWYWSSSVYDAGKAWYYDFNSGCQNFTSKGDTSWVRAVRAF